MAKFQYLLDTNILSALIKQPAGKIAKKIATLGNEKLCCTSLVVACELRYGACKKGSDALTARVEQLLDTIDVIPLQDDVSIHYGQIRTALESIGRPIGGNDLLIAAQARSLGLVVVTANTGEFSRVPGLIVENWL